MSAFRLCTLRRTVIYDREAVIWSNPPAFWDFPERASAFHHSCCEQGDPELEQRTKVVDRRLIIWFALCTAASSTIQEEQKSLLVNFQYNELVGR